MLWPMIVIAGLSSQPSSKTYSGRDSYASITEISDAAASMTAHVTTHRVKR